MEPESEQPDHVVDPALVKSMVHPVRVMIAALISHRPTSAAELAAQTDIPVEKVRYHLRALQEAGLIEIAREEMRRGVIERYYSTASSLPMVEEHEWQQLTLRQRRLACAQWLRAVLAEAGRALVTGEVSERNDQYTARVALQLDERGWRELVEVHAETLDAVKGLRKEAAKRVAESGEEPMEATSVQMCFEILPDR